MKRIIKGILLAGVATIAALIISFLVLVALPVPPPPTPIQSSGSLAITDVSVIDTETGQVISEQTVVIENGRIANMGHKDDLPIPENARQIDVAGKYLIPALWDMHVHQGFNLSPQLSMPLFIAAGVAYVRDLGASASLEQKKLWHKQVETGELLGPRIMAQAGPLISRIMNDARARQIVNSIVDPQTDFVKVLNRVLPGPFFTLLEIANQQGVAVLGHRPRAVKAVDAANAGFKSFEHARLFLFECYPGAQDLREQYRRRTAGESTSQGRNITTATMREMIDNHDPELFIELVTAMVANNTWFCPTHITRKMDAFADDDEFRNDPRLRYSHFLVRIGWQGDADRMIARDPSPQGRKAFMDFYLKGLELTGEAHRAGVKILAGTDANDSYCIPGFGMHDELQELVKAGLTPLDAIKAATVNPAEYFGRSVDYGSVAVGKIADLVLLEANPLTDISNIAKINSVIFGGNVYTREDLDNLLYQVEQNASSWSIAAKLIWQKIGGG